MRSQMPPPSRQSSSRPSSRRRPRAAGAMLAVLALAGTLAACAPGGEPQPPGEPSPTDSSTAGLEEFYGQELAWEACDDYATTTIEQEVYEVVEGSECARMAVPLDYENPEGEEASVAVLRVPARGESQGPLVINPGGPGGSGLMGAVSAAAGMAESPVTEKFDMVGFDPRGVGATTPTIDCYSDAEADTGAVALGSQGTTVQFTEEDTRALMERCAEGSGGMEALTHVGTRDTARDMDVLREVLGQEKLTYLGQSYGTRLGAVYAEQFPERVRAMILDSAGDPTEGTLERRTNAYAGFQEAFDSLAEACAAEPDCPLGDDPAQATERFQEIMQPLRENPVPAQDVELTFDAAVGGMIAGLYSPQNWEDIITGIREVEQGRGDTLLQLGYAFSLRDPEGGWTNQNEANHAINCMDEERLSTEEGAQLRQQTYEQAPFMDPGVDVSDGAREGCEHWPAEPTLGFPHAQDIEGLPETLVVALTQDPTTPYAGSEAMAASLGSSLLTVEGQGHTIVATGLNDCVNQVAADYLIDLKTPEEGASCTL
ncbi:alpha/beta hydrolase [Citricoccus sp. K5]|uniref:alpha/beta hydrolase n=1 Tax=Citricoccus sp. K5 TaxID=2653135 RepID=UPI0019163A71|nr:alpha/beta hydrolase [Citricoccus sp. K5]